MTGNELRHAIRALDRTAREVAAHLGIREETLSRLVNRKQPVPRSLALLLAEWLGPTPVNPPPRKPNTR